MKRTPRIEIKVVTEYGTTEYKHAKGYRCPDGTMSSGPSEEDFAKVHKLILDFLGVVPVPEPKIPLDLAAAEKSEHDQ